MKNTLNPKLKSLKLAKQAEGTLLKDIEMI